MPISCTLRCTFDVAKFDELAPAQIYRSAVIPVFHKDVAVKFDLHLNPKDTRAEYWNNLGVYLTYVDGPKEELVLNFELFTVSDDACHSLVEVANRKFTRGMGWGRGTQLPRAVTDLAKRGHLKSNNTLLEIKAKITMPNDAFDNPDGSHEVLIQPQTKSRLDPFRLSLFKELSTPVVTNQPFCERFQLRATNCSFWTHKSILAFSSEVFKEWLFHPEQAPQFTCFKKGVMNVELSKNALWHMLHFIYLETTAKGFKEYALEIVETAERFRFKELKRVCERSLLGQLDSMSMESQFECLIVSDKFGLTQLKAATLNKLPVKITESVENQEEFLVDVITFAQKHDHLTLKCTCDAKLSAMLQFSIDTDKFLATVSIARKLNLSELSKWCRRWMARNYQAFVDGGHLTRLMNDQSEDGQGVIRFLMQGLCKISMQQELG